MKTALIFLAASGLASSAFGQSATLSIVPSVAIWDTTISTTYTLSVYAEADFGTAISGGEFAIAGFGNAAPGVTGMVGQAAAWGALGFQDNGYAGNGNYNGMIFGQLIFPPFIPPAPGSMLGNGPVLLGSITVTLEANTFGWLEFATAAGMGDFVLEIYTDDGGGGTMTQLTGADIIHDSVVVMMPSPSTFALFGLGGLVAGRRRR